MSRSHHKRLVMPRTWPLTRKTNIWAQKPNPSGHQIEMCMPLGIILRDVLGVAHNMREAKRILHARSVMVDGKVETDRSRGVGLMDVLTVGEENYRCILDTNGKLRTFKLPAHYAPKARQKLLSTSTFCKIYPHNEIKITPKSWTIKRNPKVKNEANVEVMISQVNNLPMSICMRPDTVKKMALNFAEDLFATRRNNQNLSESKKELLCWHYRLGHIGLRTVQFLF
mgnify:CR=1 FL=1